MLRRELILIAICYSAFPMEFTRLGGHSAMAQTPLGTDFTYQGQLMAAGMPTVGTADYQFSLYDSEAGGSQIGPTIARNNVAVVDGLFTVSLDFGPSAFIGNACWIEVAVRSPAGSGDYTTLSPRQRITATPHATYAGYSDETRGISVDAAGQVGIGTSTPGKELTVAGDMELGVNSADYRRLRMGGGNSDGFLYGAAAYPGFGDGIHMGYNYFHDGASGSAAHHIIRPDEGTSRISMGYGRIALATSFGTNGFSEPPEEHVVIDSFGQIGIGTDSPQQKLHVAGGMRVSNVFARDISAGSLTSPGALRIYGGEQNYEGQQHLIWEIGEYLYDPFGADPPIHVLNPELNMVSPVTGDDLAGFYRDHDTGNGVMFADDKNFRAPNPVDPATDIWYCCLEGPEAAMYARGTARLINGRAVIDLPDHFRNLAVEAGMTVQLTPRSLTSKGLGSAKTSLDGIEVGELGGGAGDYEFDWRVEAVRKGYEDYKVIRPWRQSDPDPDKAWQNRLKWIEERRAHGKPSPDVEAIPQAPPD